MIGESTRSVSVADNGAAPALPARRVRSFVLRQGRITPAQQRAFDAHWARWGIDYAGTLRDYAALFGRAAPRIVEVGFGNGEQLHYAAAHDPARDYIGIEVHRPGVGRLLNALAADGLCNVRVYRHDAVDVLREEVAPASLAEIRIYFPDPWPKKRHHKRRLVQPAFVALAASRLLPGGLMHVATDWADYAAQMLAVLDACPLLINRAGAGHFAARPPWRIATHFEKRGQRLGHSVWDILHERR